LRFPGFEEDWVTKKFAEVGVFFKGTGISKDKLTENGNPCILYGELYTKYKNEVIKEVFSKTDINPKGLVSSKANDIIIPSSGESAVDIATACCVNMNDVLLGGDLNVIRPYKDNGNFISYQLNGKRKLEIAKIAQGSSVTHLYNGSLQKLKINLPSNINEQDKIASLLSIIDDRIATQNKIIQQLETLIKGIGEKLFSQKIRFKEFIGEWELKKLGEVFYSEKGKGLSKDKLTVNGEYECVLYGELYTKYKEVILNVVSKTNEDDGFKSQIGDLLIPSSTTTTGIDLANVTAINKENVLLGGDITVLRSREKINNVFYAYYLSNYKKEEMASYAQGSTIVHLYYSHIKDMAINFPSFEEQNKISQFLLSIDAKIQTEKNLLDKYQSQKQYLLQNLFI